LSLLRNIVRAIVYAILLCLSYLASFTLAFEIVQVHAVGYRNMNFNDWQDYWHWNWHAAGEMASFNSILSYILFVPVAAAVLFLARRIEKRLSKPPAHSLIP
jgi:ascorbate-specific PTS system EIIC-type component UlaA